MFKKLVSLFLLACTFFVCIPFGMVFAQSEEDFIKSIPIVEFQPSTKNDTDCYSKSNIISVSKETALSTESSVLKSLISEDRVVFFEKMTSCEVFRLTGIDALHPTDKPTDCSLIGTSLTYQNGVPVYIELFAMDVNNGSIELVDEETAFCIKRVYFETKKESYGTKGGLTDLPCDKTFYHYIYMYDGSSKIALLKATAYLYSYGKIPVNGKPTYVYDVKTSFMFSPEKNRCVKSMGLAIGNGGHDVEGYDSIDATTINSDGVSHTIGVTYSLGLDVSVGGNIEWSHTANAFNSINDFSDSSFLKWTINPISPQNNDTWKMQPGVRFISPVSTVHIWIGFKGTLYSTSIFKPHPVGSFLRAFNNVELKNE